MFSPFPCGRLSGECFLAVIPISGEDAQSSGLQTAFISHLFSHPNITQTPLSECKQD